MDLEGWNERYRSSEQERMDRQAIAPTPLLVEFVDRLQPGTALDLACGTGRNALWLAQKGWDVTAVDGSAVAVATLNRGASLAGLGVRTVHADLQAWQFAIEPAAWDLIVIAYYLQRDLIEAAQKGLRRGGLFVIVVHTTYAGEEPTEHRLRPGELRAFFRDWKILHDFEGMPKDPEHKRPVAEIVAEKAAS